MKIGPGDRGVSAAFYHDMGLVGCTPSMVANQMSVDYLKTEDFARARWRGSISSPATKNSR